MSQKVVERPRQSVGSYYLGAQNKIKTNIDMIFQMLVSNSTIDENAGNQRLMNEFHFDFGTKACLECDFFFRTRDVIYNTCQKLGYKVK